MLPALLLLLLQNEPTGAIEGRVVDRATGAGVRRAQVFVNGGADGKQVTAQTDASGRFLLPNVRPGAYRVTAQHPAYPAWGPNPDVVLVTAVAVKAGETARDVVVKLTPPAAVEGRVVDSDGDPLPQCNVTAYSFGHAPDGTGARQLIGRGHATTDDRGQYRMFDLPAGRYYFAAACNPRRSSGDGETEIWIEQFYPNLSSLAGAPRTPVAAGANLEGIDFRMRRGRAYTVRGRVAMVDAKQASSGFHGMLLNQNDETSRMRMMGFGVNANGTFEVQNVLPGAYRVRVASIDQTGPRYFGEADVIVGERPPQPVTVDVRQQPPLAGVVEWEGSAERRAGDVRVWLQPAANDGCASRNQAVVGANGNFQIDLLQPGECTIQVSAGSAYLKSVTYGGQPAPGNRIQVAAGASAPLRLVLSAKTGALEGTTQLAATGMTTVAVVGDVQHTLMAQPDGRFQFSNLPPGSYRVWAYAGMPIPFEWLKELESRAKVVKVEEAGQANVQLDLVPADQISALQEKFE